MTMRATLAHTGRRSPSTHEPYVLGRPLIHTLNTAAARVAPQRRQLGPHPGIGFVYSIIQAHIQTQAAREGAEAPAGSWAQPPAALHSLNSPRMPEAARIHPALERGRRGLRPGSYRGTQGHGMKWPQGDSESAEGTSTARMRHCVLTSSCPGGRGNRCRQWCTAGTRP